MIDEAVLIEKWNAGASLTQLGRLFGVTANSVVSKISRLRRKGVNLRRGGPPKPQPRLRRPSLCEAMDLFTLGADDCRYIVGENKNGAVYCKQPQHYKSYCKDHAKLCYVAARPIGIVAPEQRRNASDNGV